MTSSTEAGTTQATTGNDTELERLIDFAELDLDIEQLQDEFSTVIEMAQQLTGAEVALINILDAYTQWSVAASGLSVSHMDKNESVCQYTVRKDEPLEIPDLRKDNRFKDRFYVEGEPHLTYYYGVPFKGPDGAILGSICILNKTKMSLTDLQKDLLAMMSKEISERISDKVLIGTLRKKYARKQEAIRIVNHDIRSPLASIVDGCNMLLRSEEVTRNQTKVLELIRQQSKELIEYAEDTLSDEREDEESEDTNVMRIDLEAIKQSLIKLYGPLAHQEAQVLDISIDQDEPFVSDGLTKSGLIQIVGNLVANAIRYNSPNSPVTVSMQIEEQEEEQDGEQIAITVTDYGSGMTQEKIDQILNGGDADRNFTDSADGFGVGLLHVYSLIKRHNGTFSITSELDEGSTFRITIPGISE